MGACTSRQVAPAAGNDDAELAIGRARRPRPSAGGPAARGGAGAGADAAAGKPGGGKGYDFYTITDKFSTLEEVSEGLREAGLESSQLILAIDWTKSNMWTGKKSYGGRCLHFIDPLDVERNPYQQVIEVIGKVLAPFDDDNLIPVFGFGDATTQDRSVFPFFADRPCRGFTEVLARYKELNPRVTLSGTTNYAPAIEAAVQITQATKAYHILVIIADGQVTNRVHTEAAIVRASEFPLSIVLVGVGDGPWDAMEEFDDALPARRFDNFQFVNFTEVAKSSPANVDVVFAVKALMEVPEQFLAIRKLGLV